VTEAHIEAPAPSLDLDQGAVLEHLNVDLSSDTFKDLHTKGFGKGQKTKRPSNRLA
jgi:hypothetical protein